MQPEPTIGDHPAPCTWSGGCSWTGPARDRRYGLCPEHARSPVKSNDPTPDRPPLDLDAIRARADAATPGPWMHATHTGRKDGVSLVGQISKRGTGQAVAVLADSDVRQRAKDAEFVAHAREDVPALVAEVERLRAANAHLIRNAEILADEIVLGTAPVFGGAA
jgi:hypothetical protein